MFDSLVRLSPYPPGEPAAGRRAGKPHESEELDAVRRLIETTHLPYRVIAARTGVPRSTISRHVLDQGWIRPSQDADMLPDSPAARRRARSGELAELVLRAAEQRAIGVAMNPTAHPSAFAQAARLIRLVQDLDRPGPPRSRVPRARRVKAALRGEDSGKAC